MVHRGAGGRYQVGVRAFCLGQGWRPASVLRAAATAPMRRLSAASRENVSLTVMDTSTVLDIGAVLVVGGMTGRVDAVFSLSPGVVLPAASAAEAVIAAARPEAETPQGHSRAEWVRRIRRAREEGVSFDVEMTAAPVACLAAPVHAPSGAVVAAVGVAVLDPRGLPQLVEAVRDTADRVSANLTRVPGAGRTLRPLAGTGDH